MLVTPILALNSCAGAVVSVVVAYAVGVVVSVTVVLPETVVVFVISAAESAEVAPIRAIPHAMTVFFIFIIITPINSYIIQ